MARRPQQNLLFGFALPMARRSSWEMRVISVCLGQELVLERRLARGRQRPRAPQEGHPDPFARGRGLRFRSSLPYIQAWSG